MPLDVPPGTPVVVFPLPVGTCRITSTYGPRSHPTTREESIHAGVDLGAPEGTPILAFAAGTVSEVELESPIFGGRLTILHELPGGPVRTTYAHLWSDDVAVTVGQQVAAGEVVGRVGGAGRVSGPHLHFELHVDGDAVDPAAWVEEHDAWAAAVWRLVPTNGRSRRRQVRRWLSGLV